MEEKIDVLNELGEFTGKVATRDECHQKGLWHRAVYAFIIDKKGNVLLQKRSANKKMWPNMWDVTVGGHVDSNEFGRQALIREVKEELGIDIKDEDIKYLIGSTSINKKENIDIKYFLFYLESSSTMKLEAHRHINNSYYYQKHSLLPLQLHLRKVKQFWMKHLIHHRY